MNIENLMKVTNDVEFDSHRDALLNELIEQSDKVFMQNFDKEQVEEFYEKFIELNDKAKELNIPFLDQSTHAGTFIHMVLKELIRKDEYGKNVI